MIDSKIKYYLLFAAHPLSDDVASIALFRLLKPIDILSDNIKIYLPGFHHCTNAPINDTMNVIIERNKKNDFDYHGRDPLFTIQTQKKGAIIFNDVDFARFMLDLQNKCPSFQYLGQPLLVVIPSTNGTILYDQLHSFNLSVFYDSEIKKRNTMESFLLRVFNIIKQDKDNNNINLINKIQNLYSTSINEKNPNVTDAIIKIDNDILKHMHWRNSDNIFFISYSTKDEFYAYALKRMLNNKKKRVWLAPDGIPSGYDYACTIPSAVRISSRIVVLLSDNSAKSEWVEKEICQAISKHKRIDGVFLNEFTVTKLKEYLHMSFLFENIQLHYNIDDLFSNEKELKEFIR